ncbi:MAG: cyclomaltodextrinase N-terminal domain-containing protein [Melioribacteraceae bacterium]|nr:cyclomaltodextrinase N-terminal domain-containing protein [Melioribacteraceae bacterium]MCF8353881.1 cyclomaltodextrinase N-terminal domain-containing protein [Melioribacteraceae bacterium]MCF8393114.1 cyclomaltodextrinase N-terminal domain-containing protein [Melioribacteraceae bacterium]MCF8419233.1 cyclomaltodextrinase N-terminal domain-containing protein [Melioribacteraceae bacterium]
MKIFNAFFLILFLTIVVNAQSPEINKIEPPNWWIGMKLNRIQLMVYGENLTGISAKFNNDNITVDKIHELENHTCTFIDITIPANLEPGDFNLIIENNYGKTEHAFPIFARENNQKHFQGFDNSDAIYLLMPDRFANGDPANDSVEGLVDTMQNIPGQARAGGDLQGVIDKLDYIKDLGFTTIWLNPVVENNTFRSYHGYSATDFYNVDARLGTNELYKKLVDEAHARDMKIIIDHVANHFSSDHVWITNPPMNDWTNGTIDDHLRPNHHKMIFTDVHGDSATINHVTKGWFVKYMPDFNHGNPFVQNYITQNTIWWVEYSGLDGIREDTYPYAGQKYMAKWAKTILDEYPSLNIVGEVWTGEPAFLAGYQSGTPLPRDFDSNLPSLTDFGLRDQLTDFASGRRGLYNIYTLFAKDYLYADPDNLVTFADNHDVGRIWYYAKGNWDRVKIILTILATSRGIPQIFYGTELGIESNEDHGTLRYPFPGGFPGDSLNAFTAEGRSDYQNEIFDYLKWLLHLRKDYPALATGKMIHFPPHDGIYVYYKILGEQKFMIAINESDKIKSVDFSMKGKLMDDVSSITNMRTNEQTDYTKNIDLQIEPVSIEIYILE